MATQTRPLGIVLIVIFFAIVGVLGSLGGACAMMAGGALVEVMETARQAQQGGAAVAPIPELGAGWMVMSLVGVVASFLQVAAAYGLWSFQRWGRPLGLYLAAFSIAWGLFWYIQTGGGIGGFYGTAWALLMLAIQAAIVWYLRTPEVVALYDGAPAPAGRAAS